MTLREFNRELEKRGYNGSYEYIGFYTSSRGYKERMYQNYIAGTNTSIDEPITNRDFEKIIEQIDISEKLEKEYNDMSLEEYNKYYEQEKAEFEKWLDKIDC
jgi:hypothetical protein